MLFNCGLVKLLNIDTLDSGKLDLGLVSGGSNALNQR